MEGETKQPVTRIDWMSLTYGGDNRAARAWVDRSVKGPFPGEWGPVKAGMHHFKHRQELHIAHQFVGSLMWGGDTQLGRARLELTGRGCDHVESWEAAEVALEVLDGVRFTRVDIAADFFGGEVSHDRVLKAYESGKFQRPGGGARPDLEQQLSTSGRTVYVGKRGADQRARCYEKGRKEFDGLTAAGWVGTIEGISARDPRFNAGGQFDLAKWYRVELELRGAKRQIPIDTLTRRDEYFAGAWPFMAELLPDVRGEIFVRPRELAIAAIERALDQVNAQYGRVLYTALAYYGGDYLALCDRIIGREHSERLLRAGALLALDDERAAVSSALSEAASSAGRAH